MCTFNNRVVVPETLSFRESAFIVGETVFLLVMGERNLPCGILRFTTIGAVADNFHVSRQDGVQGHGQERTDGVRRGQ